MKAKGIYELLKLLSQSPYTAAATI